MTIADVLALPRNKQTAVFAQLVEAAVAVEQRFTFEPIHHYTLTEVEDLARYIAPKLGLVARIDGHALRLGWQGSEVAP